MAGGKSAACKLRDTASGVILADGFANFTRTNIAFLISSLPADTIA